MIVTVSPGGYRSLAIRFPSSIYPGIFGITEMNTSEKTTPRIRAIKKRSANIYLREKEKEADKMSE